ncbi:unnamed protein product [Rotaria magnacalcarata]|uniref:Uncharacterized protein n=1 Tax=Rotaria magnacalcarata TaxID=392030 RepID=A0A8S2Y8R6_9BILA|nr:unnamed protein product [Rotaria magnacalcarata]
MLPTVAQPPQQRVLPARLAPRQHQHQQQLQQRPQQLQQQRPRQLQQQRLQLRRPRRQLQLLLPLQRQQRQLLRPPLPQHQRQVPRQHP